ncbi:LPO_1073/Vpar_1526 family protein [Streptomyces longwoodensis]|uniref:LPO_1073/Vpar_1526 family protein n=1 Tax=Streptomyces longwoodensis TaxID=68231 RepID=UPI0033F88A0B
MWQRQKAGDGAALLQAKEIRIGVGVEDVEYISKKMAMEVLSQFSQDAYEVMRQRVEEFAQAYIGQLASDTPAAVGNLKDPGVQAAILDAESAYAKSGDEELGSLLVDILTKRTKTMERGVHQLALNEALNTSQKLTTRQYALLSLIFIIRYVQLGASSIEGLHSKWRSILGPLVADLKISTSNTDVQHLLATGCLSLLPLRRAVHECLLDTYSAFFALGFPPDDTVMKQVTNPSFFQPCMRNAENLQVAALNLGELDAQMEAAETPEHERALLRNLLSANPMNGADISTEFAEVIPGMKEVVPAWDNTMLSQVALNSVGLVIAHSNIMRLTEGEFGTAMEVFLPED